MNVASILNLPSSTAQSSLFRGQIVKLDEQGRITVRASQGLVECDFLETGMSAFEIDDEVLVWVGESQGRGVVLGRIRETAPTMPAAIAIRATESLTLQCGEASLNLRADGKVMIKGEDVLLRAKGTQRIRAGTVAIN